MKTWHNELPFSPSNQISDEIFTESSLFFDIETTGFSPAHTSLYLIGCARRIGNTLHIDQFFAEEPKEEADVLLAFLELISSYSVIISFNGVGFDLPYLKAKCEQYQLTDPFANFEYLDIFKIVSQYKFLFQLPNYKQKTVEHFLGIRREDTFDGGQLIPIYRDYVKKKSSDTLSFLKLHNYEDVIDMVDLLPVLTYPRLFTGNYSILSLECVPFSSFDGSSNGTDLIFTLQYDFFVPQRVSCRFQDIHLTAYQNVLKLAVRIYEGELKFFYPNPKDYFYLPNEDRAIHKSVASYVEKEFRQKAKPATCYNRKCGVFLPQFSDIMHPAFRKEYKDKISYFELTDDFSNSDELLHRYISHLLLQFTKKK
ncbi:MAG: ribonuclease H-like domain-containing protein [Roseburia sp.]|uniref:ribonuclease H-like domain-containing protein n=1 Tax=Roseburia sp. 831b TaxID=1261635 RepID=UPI000952153C|nr:ribonuclease H-like domain-containing protein [Roseburia sp. 831b]MCI5920393.1 ribonuclease H-like domain-containing protein [Roseburia sp.]MDD6216710.1 ribonuclease H-like domain-containing protein [Roseburia sp.]WVK74036.1 ribonuclease H-like domain-containing protein [Roseburia sp. 831b]